MAKMKYRISARATILLGRESVSKVDGAIIELVKNTYDADSVLCFICFDIAHDCIYILDNGVGMTKEIIENHWMLIGTDNKRENFRSEKKRIKSGEKGIGRFALDRLGSKCEMYTKNKSSERLILWETDWENFEQSGKSIDEVEAEFTYLDSDFKDKIPPQIYNDILNLNTSDQHEYISLETGTLFKISKLRDTWTEAQFLNILSSLGFLVPPLEQNDYVICVKKTLDSPYIIVDNEVTDEYDYKLFAHFNGDRFMVEIDRNEFDLKKIPKAIFQMDRFQKFPYRLEDFENKKIYYNLPISELMNNKDEKYIDSIKKIGEFQFNYTFMKLSLQDDSKETFFYKEISKKRTIWLNQHAGIKIYRDHFLVRPYGDKESDSFDWLGIDARRATNPAAISHQSGRWRVRNAQGQGTVLISRITNNSILDKSSREGIIENEYFKLLKDVIINLVALFEQDRAYIGRTMKLYSDEVNEKEKTKKTGKNIAKQILKNQKNQKDQKDSGESTQTKEQVLAKTVQYYEEERVELITEIKLLRSLATNGLITTSIVHDLKGINAILVNRVDAFNMAINKNNKMLIDRNLEDLKKSDIFLKSWITVITNQIKKDKRKRISKDLYITIQEIITILDPILKQKKIQININSDNKQISKKIFVSDFESIMYNLIINSIESFEKSEIRERIIDINMITTDEWVLQYKDNGSGLDKVFKDPYDIFTFGTTSKHDINGNPIGTGLGMYIVVSTAREYNAHYKITEHTSGFGLELKFPI